MNQVDHVLTDATRILETFAQIGAIKVDLAMRVSATAREHGLFDDESKELERREWLRTVAAAVEIAKLGGLRPEFAAALVALGGER